MPAKPLEFFFKKDNIAGLIYGFCVFLLCMPYFMWETGKFKMYIFIIIGVISFSYLKRIKRYVIVLIFLFTYLFLYSASDQNAFGLFFKLLLISFVIVREDILLRSFYWFKKIFTFSLILSLIVYLLIVFFFIQIDYNTIAPLNSLKSYNYAQYPFLVSTSPLGFNLFSFRFFGMFDESGFIGSFAAMFLFVDKFNLKNKQNIIIFIAGILSFSLYFIITSAVYFLLATTNRIRIVFAAILLMLSLLTVNNDIIKTLVWDRLVIENGELIGDNRTSKSLDQIYTTFVSSGDLFWGKGLGFLSKYGEVGNSSYKELIISFGIVFFALFSFTFIFFAYNVIKSPKYILFYLFIFFSMVYQRPFIFDPAYFFMFVSLLYAYKQVVINESYAMPQNIQLQKNKLLVNS